MRMTARVVGRLGSETSSFFPASSKLHGSKQDARASQSKRDGGGWAAEASKRDGGGWATETASLTGGQVRQERRS